MEFGVWQQEAREDVFGDSSSCSGKKSRELPYVNFTNDTIAYTFEINKKGWNILNRNIG